ncbi:MAG: CHRD domain-containing protein [Bacteroidetes bacterium]|nr:CHRD domain-containing protein [Bacteroidota bacterium]
MKHFALVGIFLMTLVMGCKDKEEMTPETAVTATLSGASEVPANSSKATGKVDGTFNEESKMLMLNVTYSGFTPTAWHIHKAAAGSNGGVIFNLGTTFTSPFMFMQTLNAEQEADLKAGMYYVNLHSAAFPGGELRGQLKAN